MENIQGSFGYKIGRKMRLMCIQYDANYLWQTCVREIYVLMKHYGSIEVLQQAFEGLKEVKNKPKSEDIEKCKPYTDLTFSQSPKKVEDWFYLTKYCQHSYINILDCGYFLNNHNNSGLVFLLDFNTKSVILYNNDILKKKIKEFEKATIDEIMEYDEMPTKSMTEILTNTKERYQIYSKKIKQINENINSLKNIINKTNELGGEQNIIQKTKELLDNAEWEHKKIVMEYRYFYHRLNDLNLIE